MPTFVFAYRMSQGLRPGQDAVYLQGTLRGFEHPREQGGALVWRCDLGSEGLVGSCMAKSAPPTGEQTQRTSSARAARKGRRASVADATIQARKRGS